ncbi:biosynthetic-type acetolactate synthase large subunit [Thermanaerosceptrum fracticalcis]|uniref:Acetolactate synthase n=1 Tax=Thermanaerosceptrum fracticalcis TaxID=1712410 RepID=A0A7G6E3I0_THEFR|nr:biosynthetic-type acetolactate synthase large subunit [Thermanaerosceptrum fracticalcis]QNB46634.1 biosynthetic-type acetolactate synthase large subunit [Thermanaerosceptrum fracticalcis]
MLLGAEILVKCLEKEGVEVIFGYPGGAVLEIYDALMKSEGIRHVLVRHEQGAAHEASGYARASGKVGVCLATSGPGATNLVTGIATAYMDSIPLVVITGQVSTSMVGTDAFQEVDITGITDPITKYNYLVKDPRQLPRIVKEAFHIARSGRPGPVVIDIPRDVSASLLEYEACDHIELRGYKPNVNGHAGQIKQVVQLLMDAKRPLICAGGGVISAGAGQELTKIAEILNVPVVSTMMGLGAIPGDHPLALGMLGTYGVARANLAVSRCDLFVALGMRFDDRVTGNTAKFAPGAKIVHIDIDPAEIGKNVRVDIPLVGDLKIVLNQLVGRLVNKENAAWWEEIASFPPIFGEDQGENPEITVPEIMKSINELAPDNIIFTTDVGQHQIWAAQLLKVKKPRTFISSGGLGTMGYGIPAAVGAQVACPGHTVLVITGDGSFQMGMPELGTALEQDLPLKVLIINNQTLGMVKQLQDHYCGGRYAAVHFKKNPDFHYLAKAYGALALKITRREEIRGKVSEFLQHPGLAVLEVIVTAKDNVYPMVLAGCGLAEMIGRE